MQTFVFQGIKGWRTLFYVEAETEEEARVKLLEHNCYTERNNNYHCVTPHVFDIELKRVDNIELRDCPFCGGKARLIETNVGENSKDLRYSVGCSTKDCMCYVGPMSLGIKVYYHTCKAAAEAWNRTPSKKEKAV